MTQLDSSNINNTKSTSTEYDSQFVVSPTVTTTYRVEAYNDNTKYKTCIVKVPNITLIQLSYSTIDQSTVSAISSNTTISVNEGATLYLAYSVIGDGTVDLPTSYQTASWSDNLSTSTTRSITLSTKGTYTFQLTSSYNSAKKSYILTVEVIKPTAVVDTITATPETVTINSGESTTINSIVTGQYLTGGVNVYYS